MDAIIQTTDLGRAFPVVGSEPFWALKNLSISIPEGKLTILRGKSGSGKTTLMNILSALDRPTTGSVFFDGIDLNTQTDTALGQLRRKNVGFVFQSVALIPVMNAYENVEFALRLAGSKIDNRKRVEECLKMVGLGGRMMHMPQELSGGEQQRVAIARALVNSPRMIVADEPTGNLDPARSLELMLLLEKINEMGTTVLVVTHEKELVNAFNKRVITIDSGNMVSDGVEGYYA